MKESAERPWESGASRGHTIAFLFETITYFWHALEVLHITFLCCIDVKMIIEKCIKSERGGNGDSGKEQVKSIDTITGEHYSLEPCWLRTEFS